MNDINLISLENSVYLKKISSKTEISKDDNCDGYFIEANEKEARRIIDSLKGKNKKIALIGSDDAFNRRAIETLKIDFLVSPEKELKKDTLRQKDSGLNHIVAKEAKKKNIPIVIDLGSFTKKDKTEKIKILARLAQNVKICRRAKCDIKIASFAKTAQETFDEKGRQAFGTTLGMSSEQARDCVRF